MPRYTPKRKSSDWAVCLEDAHLVLSLWRPCAFADARSSRSPPSLPLLRVAQEKVERMRFLGAMPIEDHRQRLRRIVAAEPSRTIQQALAACAVRACRPRTSPEDAVRRAALCLAQGQALREHQRDLVLHVARPANKDAGVLLSAGCGAGKKKASVLATLACFPEVSHSVVVVPTMTLVKQFIEEIVQSCANWHRRSPAEVPTIALFTLSRGDEGSFRELVDRVWVKHWQSPHTTDDKRACREARLRARHVLVGAEEARGALSDPGLLSYFVTCTNSIVSYVKTHAILPETPSREAECCWEREAFLASLHGEDVDALFERNLTCHRTEQGVCSSWTSATTRASAKAARRACPASWHSPNSHEMQAPGNGSSSCPRRPGPDSCAAACATTSPTPSLPTFK